ncbi:nitroreductase family protein [uncultured Intestinibacter sp.]|jgi:nitroreductase|uniref:nitroreductase family protein n=1 Tax=uncultured Intestinibacter sp. TaxID=1505659 RepID=UPI002ED52AD8
MKAIDAIFNRRSIRKFEDKVIPKETIEKILLSGMSAPSSKNRQPWSFIVFEGDEKKQMLEVFRKGANDEFNNPKSLPNSGKFESGTRYTLDIMEQSPTVVFVYNPFGKSPIENLSLEEKFYEMANLQCVGACMENMSIAATALGIGSLWICDIYFAYNELANWLNIDGQLVACMAFGYPAESPKQRPRKKIENIVEWRV